MRKISKIEPTLPVVNRRKRTAAYARVSMETTRLAHSLSAQISYYSKLIQSNPEWEYAGVYADYGISGTGTAKREDFNRMLEDCENGKIDIILTKSISRFARNTVDLLETVRRLKSKGIEVRFEKENINSMSGDGELMLSILASFAQEESRSISENIKWAHKKAAEKGRPSGGFNTYGYKWDGEKFVIVPEEAEIVRLIFKNYLNGICPQKTVRQLHEMGVLTSKGKPIFNEGTIYQILKNEKYTGNLLLQKSYGADCISKKRFKNKGELPQVYVENSHESIISKEDFDKVQAMLKDRHELGVIAYKGIPTSCFTSKIKCGCCGRNYQRRTVSPNKQKIWRCGKWVKSADCDNIALPEEHLKRVCCEILKIEAFDEDFFTDTVKSIIVYKEKLVFCLYGGDAIESLWKPEPKLSQSERMKGNTYGKGVKWTEERRKAQSLRMKKRMCEYWKNRREEQYAEDNNNSCDNK